MAWLRWVMVPVVLFLFDACSAESANTGGETNWLHCVRDEDCPEDGLCEEGTCSPAAPDAGNATSTASADLTCGGDMIGVWTGVVPGLPEALSENPEHDDCWNIMFFDNAGTLGVTSVLSMVGPGLERTLTLRIDTDGTRDQIPGLDTNVYQVIQEVKGPITQSFGPECLNFAGRQVACEELSEPLTQFGSGEGVWRSVVCMPAANGGCDCLLEYSGVIGGQGTWQLEDDRIVLTRFGSFPQGLGVEATSEPIDYCVSADTLRFAAPMDGWWNDVAGVPLTRFDCETAVQANGPDSSSCYICPNECPP